MDASYPPVQSTRSGAETPDILRRLARRPPAGETCDLCGNAVAERHQHLAEPATRRLLCSCQACALLFSRQAETRYRLVPEEIRPLRDFEIADELWESLAIPVNMAYFFSSTPAARVVALYPGPAGATESLLTLDAWRELRDANPVLADMQPDVEGLLVNRVGAEHDYFIAPIDRFYELVGLIRVGWKGLSGGTGVWRDIRSFFDGLREQSGKGSRR